MQQGLGVRMWENSVGMLLWKRWRMFVYVYWKPNNNGLSNTWKFTVVMRFMTFAL